MRIFRGLVAGLLIAGGLSEFSYSAERVSRELADGIVGGAAVDIQNVEPNTSLVRDQLYINGVVTHQLAPGYVKVVQDTGNGKNWTSVVTTIPTGKPNEQRGWWTSSVNYPLTNSRGNLTVRVCNRNNGEGESESAPCTIVPSGDSVIQNIGLDPRVRVAKVWFHLLRDNNEFSTVTEGRTFALVDWIANGDRAIVEPGGAPEKAYNADYVAASCPVNNRWQYRFYNLDVVDASGWEPKSTNYTRFWPIDYGPADGTWSTKLPPAFTNYTRAIDPYGEYLHVYIVNQMYRRSNGSGRILGRANMSYGFTPNPTIIAVEDEWFNSMSFRDAARLIVHEFGHEVGKLEHIQDYDPNNVEKFCRGTPDSKTMCAIIGGATGAGDSFDMPSGYYCHAVMSSMSEGNRRLGSR
ncbi:hypothetical protein [Pseudomonas aeruginosa]|uniref:hypothetical protein n=1 Tax=Pseudomonas aeruginosa TaxID=287 RepID=UPI000AA2292C|nr:hypothetical protein [Pseudomonas aeruginosa]